MSLIYWKNCKISLRVFPRNSITSRFFITFRDIQVKNFLSFFSIIKKYFSLKKFKDKKAQTEGHSAVIDRCKLRPDGSVVVASVEQVYRKGAESGWLYRVSDLAVYFRSTTQRRERGRNAFCKSTSVEWALCGGKKPGGDPIALLLPQKAALSPAQMCQR